MPQRGTSDENPQHMFLSRNMHIFWLKKSALSGAMCERICEDLVHIEHVRKSTERKALNEIDVSVTDIQRFGRK